MIGQMTRPCLVASALALSTVLLQAATAEAHVSLVDPPPRLDGEAGGNQLKSRPCGQNANARTTTVTEYTGGETITITFNEYIDHPSYYRIALDIDGDDDFPYRPEMNTSQDGDDPTSSDAPVSDISQMLDVYILGYFLNDEGGFGQEHMYSAMVTLPNIDCANCTLQLIQFMYNDDQPYYYQCADITITASDSSSTTGADMGSTGAGGMTAATGAGGASSASTTGQAAATGFGGGATSATNSASGLTNTSATSAAVTAVTTGGNTVAGSVTSGTTGGTVAGVGAGGAASATTAAPMPADESGCSCRTAAGGGRGTGWFAAGLAFGLFASRRRRR